MKYPEINKETKKYWTDNDFKLLESVTSFKEMFNVALIILNRMPSDLAQVCGPISTGGKGNKEDNLNFLNSEIRRLQDEGVEIFDQMPFEETIHRLFSNENLKQGHGDVLNDFYDPVFLSRKIKTMYFISGWESSKGATWEHNRAKELGLKIVYLN